MTDRHAAMSVPPDPARSEALRQRLHARMAAPRHDHEHGESSDVDVSSPELDDQAVPTKEIQVSLDSPTTTTTNRRGGVLAAVAVVTIIGVAAIAFAATRNSDDDDSQGAFATVPVDLCGSIPPPALRETFVDVEIRRTENNVGIAGFTEPGTRTCTVESADGESRIVYAAAPYVGTVADYHAAHRHSTMTTFPNSLGDADFLEEDATAFATADGILYSVHVRPSPTWNAPIPDVAMPLLEEWVTS